MSIGYVSKNFGCEGEEQEIIFRQEEIKKSGGRAEGCRGDGRCDEMVTKKMGGDAT